MDIELSKTQDQFTLPTFMKSIVSDDLHVWKETNVCEEHIYFFTLSSCII